MQKSDICSKEEYMKYQALAVITQDFNPAFWQTNPSQIVTFYD